MLEEKMIATFNIKVKSPIRCRRCLLLLKKEKKNRKILIATLCHHTNLNNMSRHTRT